MHERAERLIDWCENVEEVGLISSGGDVRCRVQTDPTADIVVDEDSGNTSVEKFKGIPGDHQLEFRSRTIVWRDRDGDRVGSIGPDTRNQKGPFPI